VLINYSATWMAEIEDEQRKVCCLSVLSCWTLLISTTLTNYNMLKISASLQVQSNAGPLESTNACIVVSWLW
jgi:hypothetical protein